MSNATYTEIFSHWSTMTEGLDVSTKEFYSEVEKAIEKRNIPDVKLSRMDRSEGGVFSAKREYLRVQRKEFAFDIGAAPFGNGFFVSYWLGEVPSPLWELILNIPGVGLLLAATFKPATYYKIDTANMFQSLVHNAVLEVIDTMSQSKGLRALSELDKKPTMKNIFSK
mgnify:CR=1 FL=1